MSLEVLNSPILVTIQDKGRFSYTSIGVTNSGVMDEYSYSFLNKLLDNSLDTNCLEISFSNVEFKVNKNTTVALAGAKCEFFINNVLNPIWQTHNLKAGDIIKIGKIIDGTRVYLAVKNGFNIKKEFGSNSSTIKESLGGLNGDKLKKGDILDFDEYTQNYNKRVKEKYHQKLEDILELRVLLSYQDEFFKDEEKDKFFSSIYTITNDFNRMGCRLEGKAIKSNIDGIISEGIAFGSIQIPSNGQPIILLKDRQTIGGYPKIGAVLDVDCFKLSQAKPKTKVRFKEINIEEAQKISKEFYYSFN